MNAHDLNSARDIEAEAAAWIARQEQVSWTNQDGGVLEAWLSQSIAHRVAYWRLNAAWHRTKRLAALRAPEASAVASEAPAAGKRFWRRIVAVVVVLAGVGSGFTFLFAKPDEQTFATTLGEHRTIKLPDGSRIELNTDSMLRLAMDAHARTVWLDKGEAYFDVRHDTARPFTVISGDRSVTDLGTQFSVRRDAVALRVAVVQGRVLFDMAEPTRSPTLLSEGDIAVATVGSLSVTKKTARQLSDDTAWRRGMLVFDRVTLGDVAAEFNRYNREKLVIVDAKVAKRTIGATFPIHAVEQFVDVTQDVLGLHVEKHGSEIVISR
ncbi:MAG TPA: FecR domain-containing protein [Rhizomicrobium sp.]|nr:FecR domain-containing protein [Rhizomicrobium sp.]